MGMVPTNFPMPQRMTVTFDFGAPATLYPSQYDPSTVPLPAPPLATMPNGPLLLPAQYNHPTANFPTVATANIPTVATANVPTAISPPLAAPVQTPPQLAPHPQVIDMTETETEPPTPTPTAKRPRDDSNGTTDQPPLQRARTESFRDILDDDDDDLWGNLEAETTSAIADAAVVAMRAASGAARAAKFANVTANDAAARRCNKDAAIVARAAHFAALSASMQADRCANEAKMAALTRKMELIQKVLASRTASSNASSNALRAASDAERIANEASNTVRNTAASRINKIALRALCKIKKASMQKAMDTTLDLLVDMDPLELAEERMAVESPICSKGDDLLAELEPKPRSRRAPVRMNL